MFQRIREWSLTPRAVPTLLGVCIVMLGACAWTGARIQATQELQNELIRTLINAASDPIRQTITDPVSMVSAEIETGPHPGETYQQQRARHMQRVADMRQALSENR